MTRATAWEILNEFTANPSLIKHALAVEAAMRHYAGVFGADPDTWGLTGLLHDFDYERWPDPPEHTRQGAAILRQRQVPEEIVGAILSHAEWNLADYPRDTRLRQSLFAVDELCGFITAVAMVRPGRLEGLEPASVKKKMKQKSFAAAVSRDDIQQGAELLGVTLDQHIAHCIAALQGVRGQLGLD